MAFLSLFCSLILQFFSPQQLLVGTERPSARPLLCLKTSIRGKEREREVEKEQNFILISSLSLHNKDIHMKMDELYGPGQVCGLQLLTISSNSNISSTHVFDKTHNAE